MDTDNSGTVTRDEFVSGRSAGADAEKSGALYDALSAGEGNSSEGMSLTDLSSAFQQMSGLMKSTVLKAQENGRTAYQNAAAGLFGKQNRGGKAEEASQQQTDPLWGNVTSDSTKTSKSPLKSMWAGLTDTSGSADTQVKSMWTKLAGNADKADAQVKSLWAKLADGTDGVTLEQYTGDTRQTDQISGLKARAAQANAATAATSEFTRLDGDKDGLVTKDEFLAGKPENVSDEQANTAWTKIAGDSDSATQDQFLAAAKPKDIPRNTEASQSAAKTAELTAAFAQMDGDSDGTVTKDEFLAGKPETVSDEQANTAWTKIAGDSDSISQDQFVAAMKPPSETDVKLTASFTTLDGDSDGAVTKDEFLAGKPATVSTEQATTLWTKIAGDSDSVTQEQFSAALKPSDTPEQDAPEQTDRIRHHGKDHDAVAARPDPAAAFAKLDSDGNGAVTKYEFLAGKPEGVTDDQANALWTKIAGDNEGLDKEQFAAVMASEEAAGQIEAAPGRRHGRDAIASTSADAATTFAKMDGDGDGAVTRDEFLAAKPDAVTDEQANTAWTKIAGEGDSITQEQLTAAMAANSGPDRIERVRGRHPSQAVDTPPDPAVDFATLDSDSDGAMTKDEFLAAKPDSVSDEQANTLWTKIAGDGDSITQEQFAAALVANQAPQPAERGRGRGHGQRHGRDHGEDAVKADIPLDAKVMFAKLDSDSDASMTRDEFLASKPDTISDEQANILWTKVAGDGDSVTQEQFAAAMKATDAEARPDDQKYRTATIPATAKNFDTLDTNGDGSLSQDEFLASTADKPAAKPVDVLWGKISPAPPVPNAKDIDQMIRQLQSAINTYRHASEAIAGGSTTRITG